MLCVQIWEQEQEKASHEWPAFRLNFVESRLALFVEGTDCAL